MIDLGALQVKVQAETSEAEKKLQAFGASADNAGGKNAALGKAASIARKAFLAYAAAIGAAYAALKKTLDTIGAEGDEIDKQSQKINVSAEQYQTLALAAEHCGTSMSAMTRATTKAMGKGYDNIYDYLTELEKIPDASDRMAKAQEELGVKVANELAPLIKGADGIESYRAELEKLGYYSDEAVKNSAAYEDALTSLNQTQTVLKNIIAEQVMPVVTNMINKITEFVATHRPQLEEFFNSVSKGIATVIKHIKLIMGVFAGLGITATILSIVTAIGSVITAVQAILPVLAALKVAFLALSANPFALIVGGAIALAAGLVLLVKNWGKVKKAIKDAINNSKTLSAVWNAIKKVAGRVINFTVKIPGVKAAISAFKLLKSWWDKIKGGGSATFTTTKKGTGGGHRIGIKEIPFDNYNALLHKGETVLTAAETNQFKNMANGNVQALSVSQPSQATFVINLDGQTIGKRTVEYINGQTLAFNTSPLV